MKGFKMNEQTAVLYQLKFKNVYVTGNNMDGIGNFYIGGCLISYELFKNGKPKSISLDMGRSVYTIPFKDITLIEEMA